MIYCVQCPASHLRVVGIGRSYVVWQEIVDNNVTVKADTVVHVWKWWWPVGAYTLAGSSLLFRRMLSGAMSARAVRNNDVMV